jgi:purine-cytosine permease-like protein
MLEPAGGFGKFVLVILSFSIIGTCSRELYTLANDFQILIPSAHRIPRIAWVIVTAGIIIGVAIGAVKNFYTSLSNLMNFIGYFSSSYVAVVLLEWWYFRKANPASYDHAIWDDASQLPWGIAATLSVFVPWGLIGKHHLPSLSLSLLLWQICLLVASSMHGRDVVHWPFC